MGCTCLALARIVLFIWYHTANAVSRTVNDISMRSQPIVVADIQHQLVRGIHIGRSRCADRISEVPFRKSGAILVITERGEGGLVLAVGWWVLIAGRWVLVVGSGCWAWVLVACYWAECCSLG